MNSIRFILPFAKPYGRRYLAGLLMVPLSIGSLLAIPWLTGECVDILRADKAPQGLQHSIPLIEQLKFFLAAIVIFAFTRGLSLFAIRWFIISASRKVEFALRDKLFAHLQHLDQGFYNRWKTGDILARCSQDVERVRVLAGPIIMYSANTVCMLLIAIPLMISVSGWLTLLLMVPLSLLTLSVRKIGPRVHAAVSKAQETLSGLSSLSQEDFAGIRVVKSFAQEKAEGERFRKLSSEYLDDNMTTARIQAWMHPLVAGVNELSLMLLLLLGGYYLLGGEGALSLGEFIKFAGYQFQLIWPMISIGWVVNQFHRASASVVRLEAILESESSITLPAEPISPATGRIEGTISIRGLDFAYNGKNILEDISIEVPAGHTVAITGRTGSGKSTLLKTLPRIVAVDDGRIFIDGTDINLLPIDLLRRSIGYVPQESFLFSRSISGNIGFGFDEPDEGAVLSAARISRLEKDIDQFPRGWNEQVGERGVTLSGGQKQRAALARALLIQPSILLLDDSLSAVDTQTEKEILSELRTATGTTTTLVSAQRISSILHADRIYVLDQGRVAEEGTHDELLKINGLYAETYRLQLLSDELEGM
ncbi:MAG: ABC transporter ATP-binding protein [Planctomycetota bacterium]|nr:multidrug ABC transporter ATP-binding protein [Planctomycetota bacterium]MEE3052565.1 ABC transporter ATP-binding protein [Planctomycetota bacterium]